MVLVTRARTAIFVCLLAAVLLVTAPLWYSRTDNGFVRVRVIKDPQIIYGEHPDNTSFAPITPVDDPQIIYRKHGKRTTHATRALEMDMEGGSGSGFFPPPHRCLHHDPQFVTHVYASRSEASVLDASPEAREVLTTTGPRGPNSTTASPTKHSDAAGNPAKSTEPSAAHTQFTPRPPTRFRPLRVRVDTSNLFNTASFCGTVGEVRSDFLGDKVVCSSADILTTAKRQYVLRVVLPEVMDYVERLFQVAVVPSDVAADYQDTQASGEDVAVAFSATGSGRSPRSRLVVPRKACGRDGIYIPPEHGEEGEGVKDADLVIYALAAPIRDRSAPTVPGSSGSSSSSTLAWSSHCAVDVYGRPTVAHINFVPSAIQPSRTTSLRRASLRADVAASSDNGISPMVDPFGGSFTGVSASSLSSASSSPSSVSVPHVWNRRFSACPVQLSSTAAATATSSTVLPSVLHGDGDQWWTARYVRTIMHETLHILGFSPPLLTEYAVNVTHRGEDVVVISEAGPVRAARAFLACPTLDGVELEDEGGDGTALGHWERLWLRDDIMSGIPSSVSALSSITLSFLDSLPFYRVSLDYAEPMPWGAAAGCGFLDERCKPLSSPASIVRLATSRVVSNDSRPSSEPSAMSAEASPRTRRAPKALVDEGGEGTPSNSSTFTTPTPQSASTPSTTTSTTVAPTSTTTTTVPATSSTTTSTTTTTAKPTTTSTTTEVPSTTTTTTTTTTTSTTSTTPTPTTTSTTTTSTTSEAPSTSTTSTTTSASPVTVPPSPATRESRQDLLARAKYWCTDKGLTSRRVPQCTYDRRSIGICNVDFRPIKGEKIGGPRSGTTQGSPIDAQTTTTTTTTEPSEEADDSSSRDGDDDGGSGDSAHANTTSVAGAVNGTTAGTRKRPRLTGRSLLMNGCPVVEPYLNRWCTNGLLSIDLAPDAEQDVLLRSQGYYFGSQSRCAAVADFKPVTRPPVAAGEENANITVGANTSSESDIGLEAPYAQATETKDDLMNATDARCLHMRCVPKDTASAGGEDHGASTALFSAGRYRVEIEVGGFWLACPMDGRSGHITVPAETGFSGMLACDDAELLCTAELVQEPDDGVSHTQRGVATLSGTTALATASSWLPEYLVPVELLVSVTTSTKLNLASHSTDRSKSSAKKSTKNSAKKGKKQNHPSVVSAQAEMDDDSNNTALVLSAWRLTAEQCPAALRMAVQRDLDELLASASAVRQAQGLPAYTPLGTLVRQREGAMRVLPLFTASVWSGRGTAEPPSSSTRAQRKAARSERTANKSDGEKNSGVPPVLLQLGLRLAVTTAHRLALVDYIHDVTSLAWRANSSLPRVEALLMTSYQTLSTGGRRHAACAASWEVPLPGVFGDILALAEPSPDAAVLAASLWADAQPTVPGVARAMPLDGPMVPPGDVFAVAQVELQLMALLPPRRMRAAMLSHPLVLEALRHDVSALLGVTQNLVSVQNIVWAPEATATQKRSLTGESLDSARALWQTVRAFVRGGGGGASAVTTLPAGEQTIGTITALVHAHPIPDTLTFSGAVGSAKSVRGGEDNAVAHLSPDVTLYTRQYWTRVLRATVAERVPLRYTGEALSELMYGAAPSGISFLFPSVLDTKARAGKGEADVNNDDLTTLGAYDELEMFRQQSQGKQRGRGTSKTSSADPTVALREKLMTMRPALSTGTVWVGSVLRLSDGEPSVLPSTCHASMADALLERSSTVSLVSLLTPSFLRWEPSCRRWRVHGGMSWCLSVYEGRTCAEANTVDDAVRSFCTNIRTVWFMLATVSAAILLWWMYGITRCCCRLCCCRASAEVEAEDEW